VATHRIVRAAVPCSITRAGRDKVVRVDGRDEEYDLVIHASTGRVARDGGIIPVSAWERRLDAYLRNPVVLWAHQDSGPDGLPIGRAVKTELDKKAGVLRQWIRFHRETPLSQQVARLFEIGDLNAWSVGFRVHQEREPNEEERAQAQREGYEVRWVAEDAELFEVSAVPVPADIYATTVERSISRARRRGADVGYLERRWYALRSRSADEPTKTDEDELLTPQRVAKFCPPCAEKMKKLGIKGFKRSWLMSPEGWRQIPEQLLEGLCASLGGDPGGFTACMEKDFGDFEPDNKEGFCEWLHEQCFGISPAEHESAKADAERVIVQDHPDCPGGWALVSQSTGKLLGCHETKEQAEAQEAAIQANKAALIDALRDMHLETAASQLAEAIAALTNLVEQLQAVAASIAAHEQAMSQDAGDVTAVAAQADTGLSREELVELARELAPVLRETVYDLYGTR
jgi:HK97 family phage prohead protease